MIKQDSLSSSRLEGDDFEGYVNSNFHGPSPSLPLENALVHHPPSNYSSYSEDLSPQTIQKSIRKRNIITVREKYKSTFKKRFKNILKSVDIYAKPI